MRSRWERMKGWCRQGAVWMGSRVAWQEKRRKEARLMLFLGIRVDWALTG